MTSKENDDTQDKELLERYRRASATEATAPSEAVRAAILAESRRVAAELQKNGAQHGFDTTHRAANDSRWKVTAFGTLGAALLAALLIAPRYWPTQPASIASSVAMAPQPTADSTSALTPAAPAPSIAPSAKSESAPPTAGSESSQEKKVVSQADRRRTDAPKDSRLANAPVAAPSN